MWMSAWTAAACLWRSPRTSSGLCVVGRPGSGCLAQLPYGDWMPVAALVAMRASLEKSALFAEQRGAIIGAAVAAGFLLTIDNITAFEVIIVVLGGLAASIWAVNYAQYCVAVAGALLIALDLPHPSSRPTRDGGSCSPSSAGRCPAGSRISCSSSGEDPGRARWAVTALKKGRAGLIAVYATSMADRSVASANALDKYVSK
jgi:hypothetical protein